MLRAPGTARGGIGGLIAPARLDLELGHDAGRHHAVEQGFRGGAESLDIRPGAADQPGLESSRRHRAAAEGGGAGFGILPIAGIPGRGGEALPARLLERALLRQGQSGAIDLLEIAALLIGVRGRIADDGLLGLGTRALDFLGFVAGAVLLLVDGGLLGVEVALGGEPGGEGGAIARRNFRDQRAVAFLGGLQIASGKAAAARRHVPGRRLEFGLAFPVALVEAGFVVEGVLARGFGLVGRKTLASGGEAAAERLQALADRLGAGAHLRRGAWVEADLGAVVGKTGHGGSIGAKEKPRLEGRGWGWGWDVFGSADVLVRSWKHCICGKVERTRTSALPGACAQ
ncbi:hypothetical protein AB4037_33785 [Labrys sp. KB_33_2]|uniref:hypothetical protein n=1 Tax=Labrys sp. KB_33_2 TaxID=3237479 RepID=UPI003F8E778D